MGCTPSKRKGGRQIRINVIEPTTCSAAFGDDQSDTMDSSSANATKETTTKIENNAAMGTTPKAKTDKMYDVMISFHLHDTSFVHFLADKLQDSGITVWRGNLASSEQLKSSTGIGIVNSKTFVAVLSLDSVSSKACQDEVALAYISNKSIFPVSREDFADLNPHLDFGMRLTIAKLNWIFFKENEKELYEEQFKQLREAVQEDLSYVLKGDQQLTFAAPKFINQQNSIKRLLSSDLSDVAEFWERKFTTKEEVSWIEFREKFLCEYKEDLDLYFPNERTKWLMNLVYKDILELNKTFTRKRYNAFCCGKDSHFSEPDLFFHRLKDYAIGNLAMKEVFHMDSALRLDAIQNLGQFQTLSIIESLSVLLEDPDPNIRVVTAIALAKTGVTSDRVIRKLKKLLNDEDRLVRESGCLSLGKLKAESTVPLIIDLWRNDPIKHVREAATIALNLIGGKKSEGAIRVTKLLSEEMTALKPSKH